MSSSQKEIDEAMGFAMAIFNGDVNDTAITLWRAGFPKDVSYLAAQAAAVNTKMDRQERGLSRLLSVLTKKDRFRR